MPSPWDYRDDQRRGVIPPRRYYIVLVDENLTPVYTYSRLVGKFYSRVKSTRKALFIKTEEPHERIYFDQYNYARYALIEIGKTPVSLNVPVGQYNLQIRETNSDEPVAVLPYYVVKEVKYVPE